MKNKIFYIYLAVLCLTGFGCSHFLEEYSRDQVYASSCEDLDEVLIGNGYMEHSNRPGYTYCDYIHVLDDDAEELIVASSSEIASLSDAPVAYWRNLATWQKNPFVGSFMSKYTELEDTGLEKIYSHIAYVNTIINYLKEFPNDPLEDQMRIRGEGQFLRAAYYLIVSNLYGGAYDVKNGGTDMSVPLKTYEWVVESKFAQASVGKVYDYIVEDLKSACENLRGVVQKNFYRTNQLATRILLSRVYLYMENYDEVIVQCDSALTMGCPLADLNTFDVSDEYERDYLYDKSNPEIVFTMGNAVVQDRFTSKIYFGSPRGTYTASQSLIDEYKNDDKIKDLRLSCYFEQHARARSRFGVCKNYMYDYSPTGDYPEVFDSFLIRTVEAYLNKAEAQAMKGDLAGAKETLQPLLATRYATGMLPELAALGEKEMVEFIRSERRRELCFEGHRWPDLKRYAVNSKYPYKKEIQHSVYDGGSTSGDKYAGYYVLKPYGEDEGWILPFPEDEIIYNEGVLVNPNRPDRFNGDPNFSNENED